jgi:DNA-binding MarR family transcriptional regulator
MYTSKLARALEHAGLLARTGNPADPRAVQLTLTDRGVDVVVRAIAIVRDLHERLLAPLGGTRSEQTAALRDALLAMLQGVSQEEPSEE